MSNLLFTTDTDSGIVTVIDADSTNFDEVTKIPVGNGPRGAVKFTKNGITNLHWLLGVFYVKSS